MRNILPRYLDKIYFISEAGCEYYRYKYRDYNNLDVCKLGVNNYNIQRNEEFKFDNELIILSCSSRALGDFFCSR